jgi:hypothetical protein
VAQVKRKVEELPEAPNAPSEAPGVAYTSVAGAPDLKMFRCEAYRANLTMKGCGSRWREAQVASGEAADRVAACRGCAIGALHAGYKPIRYSQWFGVSICPRCSRGTTRMIGGRCCVSCYNRARELKAGRNARGNRPVELMERPLRRVELVMDVDGETRLVRDRETLSLLETIVQAMRTTKGQLAFGFAGSGSAMPPAANAGTIQTGTGPGASIADAILLPPSDLWEISDRRCDTCRGRVLRSLAGVYRCSNCATEGEGTSEAQGSIEPDLGTGSTAAAPRREMYLYRVRLLCSTAIIAAAALRVGG